MLNEWEAKFTLQMTFTLLENGLAYKKMMSLVGGFLF